MSALQERLFSWSTDSVPAMFYPEYMPYALDGSALDKALLFNLTGEVARVLDVRVPVPETLKSHSVLVTGDPSTDPERL